MNIIFLDIDGVLNSINYFIDNHSKILELYQSKDWNDYNSLIIKRAMMDIDKNKLRILKEIIDKTGSYVVVISSWKIRRIFPNIRDELINMGIPIIGVTVDYHSNRGEGIKKYLKNNDINNYVILDDEIFEDYDCELLSHLVKTSFYEDGLTNIHKDLVIKKLTRNS